MSNIEKIRQEIERRKGYISVTHFAEELLDFIDSMPEDASCTYDTNELTPIPSVNIEDVARVQFASHAHVFDRKRKAVFDWEQFKEVAGIFYGFGKRDSLPEEKPSEDLDEEVKRYYSDNFTYISSDQPTLSILTNVARHFAEWQEKQDLKWAGEIHKNGYNLCKEQMLKDAVEGEIGYWNQRGLSIRLDQSFEKLGYDEDTEVKIIIVKQDDRPRD